MGIRAFAPLATNDDIYILIKLNKSSKEKKIKILFKLINVKINKRFCFNLKRKKNQSKKSTFCVRLSFFFVAFSYFQ